METQQDNTALQVQEKPAKQPVTKSVILNQIPDQVTRDEILNAAIAVLPSNYNFEVHKSIQRIREMQKPDRLLKVVLQFPEGFLMYSCLIADIIETFTKSEVTIMTDVTYGACCIDDYTGSYLSADLILHYGHSCLVPIDETIVPIMYIFVDILIDLEHLVRTLTLNFPDKEKQLILMSTIQFNNSVFAAKKVLIDQGYNNLLIPQEKPRSPGEVLGCTSPKLPKDGCAGTIVFVADGRFHMEAAMIANPTHEFYQYDPGQKKITIEAYDFEKMMGMRYKEVQAVKTAQNVGIILGILGRQGNTHILKRITDALKAKGKSYFVVMASEISKATLDSFPQQNVDAWIQIACPRLSIDWGLQFQKPLITPYELFCALEETSWDNNSYPMDYYSNNGGKWTNYFHRQKAAKGPKVKISYEKAK